MVHQAPTPYIKYEWCVSVWSDVSFAHFPELRQPRQRSTLVRVSVSAFSVCSAVAGSWPTPSRGQGLHSHITHTHSHIIMTHPHTHSYIIIHTTMTTPTYRVKSWQQIRTQQSHNYIHSHITITTHTQTAASRQHIQSHITITHITHSHYDNIHI